MGAFFCFENGLQKILIFEESAFCFDTNLYTSLILFIFSVTSSKFNITLSSVLHMAQSQQSIAYGLGAQKNPPIWKVFLFCGAISFPITFLETDILYLFFLLTKNEHYISTNYQLLSHFISESDVLSNGEFIEFDQKILPTFYLFSNGKYFCSQEGKLS